MKSLWTILLMLIGTDLRAQNLTPVSVAFQFDVAEFAIIYDTPSEKQQVKASERRLAEAVVAIAPQHAPFVHWAADDPSAKAHLYIQLKKDAARNVVLTFHGDVIVRGALTPSHDALRGVDPWELYSWRVILTKWQPHDLTTIEADVKKLIGEKFNEAFYRQLFDGFLTTVPINEQVIPNTTRGDVEIPVPWNDIRPRADTTVLRLRFTALDHDQTNVVAYLRNVQPQMNGSGERILRARLHRCQQHQSTPAQGAALPSACTNTTENFSQPSDLAELFKTNWRGTVFMAHYDRDRDLLELGVTP